MKRYGSVSGAIILALSVFASAVCEGSQAEDAVRTVVQAAIDARQKGDVEEMLSHIADDALMETFTGNKATKSQFGEAVRKRIASAPPASEFEVTNKINSVRLESEKRAIVLIDQTGVVIVNPEKGKQQFGATKTIEKNQFEWTLENRAGTWLVIKQRWTQKSP